MNKKGAALPSRGSIENAIDVIDNFRDLCKHQLALGYWATIDFPSKHHLNKILQMQYAVRSEVYATYGKGLSDRIFGMIEPCKAYLYFLRGSDEQVEDTGNKRHNRK